MCKPVGKSIGSVHHYLLLVLYLLFAEICRMELSHPKVRQVILHCKTFPVNTLSFVPLDSSSFVHCQGSVVLRYANFTIKLTRTGYFTVHLVGNNIWYYYKNLVSEVLDTLADVINSLGQRIVERITYKVRNIQVHCTSNLNGFELLQHFKLVYAKPVECHEVKIIDFDGAPLPIDALVLTYKALRIKILGKVTFTVTFSGEVTCVSTGLEGLLAAANVLDFWVHKSSV